jgi:AraC-like DNA-binding protein
VHQLLQYRNWQSSKNIVVTQEHKHRFTFEENFPIKVNCTRFHMDHHLTPNFHDYFEIACLYQGNARIIVESKEYLMAPGDIAIIGSHLMHTYESINDVPADIVWVAFLPSAIYVPGESEIDFEYIRPFYEHQYNFLIPGSNLNDSVPDLLCRMYKLMEGREHHYKIQVKTCLYELLNSLLLYYDKFEIVKKINYDKRRQEIVRLRKVFEFVATNYHAHITLEQGAEVACMSKHYFCKFFKKVTGYTFFEYLMRFRIDKAKELILEDRRAITEIAYEVGFDNLSYFYRIFKRLTNFNPREFLYHKSAS